MNNLNFRAVYNTNDPNFPGVVPEDSRGMENNMEMPEEMRKVYNFNYPEL